MRLQACANITSTSTSRPSSSSSSSPLPPPPLVMVYVSLDDEASEFRAMLRRLGPPPMPTMPTAVPTADGATGEKGGDGESSPNSSTASTTSSSRAFTWLAVPHCDVNLREALVNQFVTSDVPTAIVLGPHGEVTSHTCGWMECWCGYV